MLRRGGRIVFCEVKAKSGDRFGDPLDMIDYEKRRRLRRAAEVWLAQHPEVSDLEVTFEFVAVRAGKLERVSDEV